MEEEVEEEEVVVVEEEEEEEEVVEEVRPGHREQPLGALGLESLLPRRRNTLNVCSNAVHYEMNIDDCCSVSLIFEGAQQCGVYAYTPCHAG